MEEDDGELTEEQATDLAAIRARKKQIVADHRCGRRGGRGDALWMTAVALPASLVWKPSPTHCHTPDAASG